MKWQSSLIRCRHRAGIQHVGCRLTAMPHPDLPFNGRHPHDPCNFDHHLFTDPGWMKGWVDLVGWPILDALPTKWSHVNHRSDVDQGKSAGHRPTFLPLSHSANRQYDYPSIHTSMYPSICLPINLISTYHVFHTAIKNNTPCTPSIKDNLFIAKDQISPRSCLRKFGYNQTS